MGEHSVNSTVFPTIDEWSDEYASDPFGVLRKARDVNWIAECGMGLMTLTHGSAKQLLRDERFVQPHIPMLIDRGVTDGIIRDVNDNTIVAMDGEPHERLRGLVTQAFTPKRLDGLRPLMREVVNNRVDRVVEAGRCEFVSDIAEYYPLRIICFMLGIPEHDQPLFVRFLEDQMKLLEWRLDETRPMIEDAFEEMKAYITRQIEIRRENPTDDLVTAMLSVTDASGDRMTTDEIIWMVDTLLVGGLDTTRCQLGHGVALLAERPNDWRRIASEPETVNTAVEEIFRYQPAVMAQARIALTNIEFDGVAIAEGTPVFVNFAAANHDPEVFEDPERFDIDRRPNPHLALGFGAHFCLGAVLARLEICEALPILAQRLPNLELDGPVEWRPPVGITGPDRLPLRFESTR
jgi:cytochrome P450